MSQARSSVRTVTDPISLSARTVTLTSYYATPRRATYVALERRIWSYSVDVDGRCRPSDQHLCREALAGPALGANCQSEGRTGAVAARIRADSVAGPQPVPSGMQHLRAVASPWCCKSETT